MVSMEDKKNSIYIEVKSSNSFFSLGELVDEAYSHQISVFHCRMGHHFPMWRKISVGDNVIYAIDDLPVCGGEISFLKKIAFRPRWFPDHETYKASVCFAQGMCCHIFDESWAARMVQQHIDAIEKKRWFFVVFAVVKPTYHLLTNKPILDDKVKTIIEADEEMERLEAAYTVGGLG